MTAAGPAAGTNKPQDTGNPLGEAVAAKLEEYNARTVADTAAQAAVRDSAEAVQQGGRAPARRCARTPRRAPTWRAGPTRPGPTRFAAGPRRRTRPSAAARRRWPRAQRQIVQDAAQRFEEVSRKVAEAAQGTTENVRRLMALPNAAEGGLRDLQQGVTGLFEGVVQTNLRAAQEVFRLANPAPFVELQQRFVREYTDTLLRNSAVLVRAVRRTADETLRPLEQQIEQQQREQRAGANENDPRFQTAAE